MDKIQRSETVNSNQIKMDFVIVTWIVEHISAGSFKSIMMGLYCIISKKPLDMQSLLKSKTLTFDREITQIVKFICFLKIPLQFSFTQQLTKNNDHVSCTGKLFITCNKCVKILKILMIYIASKILNETYQFWVKYQWLDVQAF